MDEPVIAKDGYTYEKKALLCALSSNPTSPITREPMNKSDIILNRALKDSIESWKLNLKTKETITKPVFKKPGVKESSLISNYYYDQSKEEMHINVLYEFDKEVGKDFVICIDVSGSMGQEASISGINSIETSGISILSLVCQAVKAIVHSARDVDRIALVTYHTYIDVLTDFIEINSLNIKSLDNKIEELLPKYQTNLWGGLMKSIELLDNRKEDKFNREGCIMLFTDGNPNISPSRGEIYEFRKYIKNHHNDYSLYTYGFGNNMNSDILFNLSKLGNGTYNFIPDSSFVGTILVNTFSNICYTVLSNVNLYIMFNDNIDVNKIENLGSKEIIKVSDDTIMIKLGIVHFDQCKNYILNMPNVYSSMIKSIHIDYLQKNKYFLVNCTENNSIEQYGINKINNEKYRLLFIKLLYDLIIKNITTNTFNEKLNELIHDVKQNQTSPYLKSLIDDMEGQIKLASSDEYFNKWGQHYLKSVIMSHEEKTCNNFKDQAIQYYGGENFKLFREYMDDIFTDLPPPKTNNRNLTSTSFKNMYYNSSGGCFSGDSSLYTDKGLKLVKNIKKGDLVWNKYQISYSKVVCVIKTIVHEKELDMIEFPSGLKITPWHPIIIDSTWEFPNNLYSPKKIKCLEVFNFVLNTNHIVTINNINVVTLGHNFKGNKIIEHNYFGSDLIINDLKKLDGWEEGYIVLSNKNIKRENKLVYSII